MSVLQCPNPDKIKEIVIPTKDWLVPIENMLLDKRNSNTRGNIYIANLLEKGKVTDKIIVKLTNMIKIRKEINKKFIWFSKYSKNILYF